MNLRTYFLRTCQDQGLYFSFSETRILPKICRPGIIVLVPSWHFFLRVNRASLSCKCNWKTVSSKLRPPLGGPPFVSWTAACWTFPRICRRNSGKTCSTRRGSKKRTWQKGTWETLNYVYGIIRIVALES